MSNNENRPAIPSQAFDREYNTQWRKEMEYLKQKGIQYTFVKKVGQYKIPTYKYTKTPELFLALADFYNQQNFRKNMDAIDRRVEKLPIEEGCIKIQPDNAEKKLLSNIKFIREGDYQGAEIVSAASSVENNSEDDTE